MGRIEGWKVIAAITQMCVGTLRAAEKGKGPWRDLPRIPVFRLGPRKVCIDEDALSAWLRAIKR